MVLSITSDTGINNSIHDPNGS